MINSLNRRRDEKGFTLIELLIVIIILGILAAIVVFAVGSSRSDAVANSCKTNVKSVQLDLEAILTKSGTYPDTQAHATTGTGAVLKAWPSSGDYTIAYAPVGTPISGYTLTMTSGGTTMKDTTHTIDQAATDSISPDAAGANTVAAFCAD
jgi:general secretion pathway protein G